MKAWGPLLLLIVCCRGERVEYPDARAHLEKMLVPSEFDNNIKLAADLHAENLHDLNELYLGNRLYNNESPETVDEPNIHSHESEAGDPSRREHLSRDAMTGEESTFNDMDRRGFDHNAEWSHPEDEPDDDDSLTECHSKSDDIENFVGSNLFDGNRKKCFSVDDVALLTARRDFEYLVPKDLPKCLLTDNMVAVLMQYFHCASQVIQRLQEDSSKRLCEKAFYDMLGGYLRYYIVPVTKYSFYAGKVCLDTVKKVLALYQECKKLLNTNGNGWRPPIANVLTELKNIQIEPLQISDDFDDQASCMNLDMSSVDIESDDDEMLVSLPKLEAEDGEGCLGNIWLPFKRKHIFNLRSMKSAGILVKFYETVTCCYQSRSMSQTSYNQQLRNWILENVQVHLGDEQFYPGLGSVLQIYENLQRGKKAVQFEKVVSKKTIQNDDEEEAEEEDADDEASDESVEDVAVAKRHNNNDDYELAEVGESDVVNSDDVWQKLSSEYYNDFSDGDSSKSRKDCIKIPTTPRTAIANTTTCKSPPATAATKPLTLEEMCRNITAKPKTNSKSKEKDHKKKKKKPKKKKKKKSKNKTKSKSNKTKFSNKTLKAMFVKLMHNKDSYLLYACYGLGSLILVILLCVLVLVVGRMVRRRLKSGSPYERTPECPPCPPCPKEKRGFFDCCKSKKKKKGPPQDEEVIVKSDTSSILPPPRKTSPKRKPSKESKGKEETPRRADKVQFPTTSSSSVTCKPTKWLPFRRSTKTRRGSSAPTAGEYSSSEFEEQPKSKAKPKKAPPTPPPRDRSPPPSPPPRDKSPQKPPAKTKLPPPPPPTKKSSPASSNKGKQDTGNEFKSCDCGHKGCKYCSKRKTTPTKSNDSSPTSSPRFLHKRSKKSDAKSSSDKGSKKSLKNSSSWETVYDT